MKYFSLADWCAWLLFGSPWALLYIGLYPVNACRVEGITITDWLQGVGTAVAAAVAIAAFITWRRPDDTRRRADTAELIIRQSAKVEFLIATAQTGMLVVQTAGTAATVKDKQEAAQSKVLPVDVLPELNVELTILRGYKFEAKRLYPAEAVLSLEWIDGEGKRLSKALRALKSIRDQGKKLIQYDVEGTAYDAIFKELNVRWIEQKDFPGPDAESPEQANLRAKCERLREILSSYLVDGKR